MAPPSAQVHPKAGWAGDPKSSTGRSNRGRKSKLPNEKRGNGVSGDRGQNDPIILSPKLVQEDVDILNQLSQKDLRILRRANATNWVGFDEGGEAERPVDQLSISGMSLVCNPGAFWLRRAIWLVIIICLLVWLCFQLKLCVERFMTGGTTRAWTLKNPHKIPLPAITVCHGNRFKKSVVLRHQQNGSNWQQWYTKGYRTLDWDSFTDLHAFYGEATYTWSDMVRHCAVSEQPCEKIGSLQSRSTLLNGLCTTFVSNSTVKKRLISGQITMVFSENESLDKYEHNGWKVFIHSADVNFDDFEYFTGRLTPVTVYPKRKHELKLSRQVTTRMPSGSGAGCDPHSGSHGRYIACLDRCVVTGLQNNQLSSLVSDMNATQLVCQVPWMPEVPSAPSCRTYQQLRYSSRGTDEELSEDFFVEFDAHCKCRKSCRLDRYEQKQHEKWYIDETSIYLKYPQALNMTVGALQLWLTDVEEYIVEQKAYCFETFVAEVGGNLGLMLGGSLLTFVEVLDCVIASCLARRAKKHWNEA